MQPVSPSRHHISAVFAMLRSTCSSLNVARRSAQHIPTAVRLVSSATSSRKASTPSFDPSPSASTASSSKISTPKQHHGFKHVAPTQENGEEQEQKRLLRPHILSRRLITMCREGKLDEAFEYLQSLPLDAQNVPVWNTLILNAGRAERYRLMYQIYTEVCDRSAPAGHSCSMPLHPR